MACLEYIHYKPHRPEVGPAGVVWVQEVSILTVERLPQIYWADGSPWSEANLWALEAVRSREVKLRTITGAMEHLHKYANWLECEGVDWRHFPKNKAERVLVRYRGTLVDERDHGGLAPSTTTARMRAVIRFYRYCAGRNFVSREAPKWQDKVVVVRYFDSAGFERTLQRVTADISIPNRARHAVRLEDGLLPITSAHMLELLHFTKNEVSTELHLMLMIGFFTGARLCTITSLHVSALQQAERDPNVYGMWVIPVGPGTGIMTKFDVSGNLLIPAELMVLLKEYSDSVRHTDRIIKAKKKNKRLLFLTRYGNRFSISTVEREMVTLRQTALRAGLQFMQKFRFHQSRATYGTWLMTICLAKGNVKAAIEFVKGAMHHKNEATTFGYIKFIEHTKAKIEVANTFSEAFCGLANRQGGSADA